MAAGSDGVPPARNPFGFGDESAPPTNSRSEPVTDWHAGRISTAELADLLTAEVLGDIEVFTGAQRINSQVKYGPAWSVAFWWHEVRDELDLTGFSAEDYEVLLERLAPALPDWALRPPPPASAASVAAGRECSARVYLDVDGAFSPICMNLQHERDLAWMRGPAVAIGEAPQTGWTWKMTGGFGPTSLPIELAHQLVALNDDGIEVVWVTSWHEMANTLLDACGIATRLWCHPTADDDTVKDKWQFVVTELQRDPTPFVWIDDQQITPSTQRWAATCGVANLLVHTNRYVGVTPTTWSTTVIDWLQEQSGGDLSHIGGTRRRSTRIESDDA